MVATVELPREVATAPVCQALGLSRAVVYRRWSGSMTGGDCAKHGKPYGAMRVQLASTR